MENPTQNKMDVRGDEKSPARVTQILDAIRGGEKTLQFFIMDHIEEEIRRYAETFYGNGTDDLAKGWRAKAKQAEFAVVEFYCDANGKIWERIRLIAEEGEVSYIIIQYCTEMSSLEPLRDNIEYLLKRFEYSISDQPHTDEEYIEVYGT